MRLRLLALLTLACTACTEPAGNSDVTPPVVALTSPANGALDLTGAVTVTADATDSAGITQVSFVLDGALLSQDVTAPYEAQIPATSAYTSGAHTLLAQALDENGNYANSEYVFVTFGGTVALPAGFTQVPVATGLGAQATAIAAAVDGRLFVTEKSGAIRVIKNGALLPTPFATVTVSPGSERGLIGIALSPTLGITGHVYVYYTTAEGGIHNRISRFVALGDLAGAAEEKLVDLPALSAAENHNGGGMAFGNDGKLYVTVGDNANSSLAPLLTSPFGKVLRFNADGTIPTDNPFYGSTTGINRAIWARGLRNPYTLAFNPSDGRLHVNDVGEVTWEEVNVGRAGADYGWPATEGPTGVAGVDAPLFAYKHISSPTLFDGSAIVGAAFYYPPYASPGSQVNLFGSAYQFDYFFADYVAGWIYRLDFAWDWTPIAFARTGGNPTNLAVGADGALYVTISNRVDRIAK